MTELDRMSHTLKPQELRAIEQQVEELRILNTKLNAQIKKIALSKKNTTGTAVQPSPEKSIHSSTDSGLV